MKNIEQLYTNKKDLYHVLFFTLLRYHQGLHAVLSKANLLKPGMKVLDAGCGSGAVTKALQSIAQKQKISGITFHGFDLTQAMLDQFKVWINNNKINAIELQQADVLDLTQLPQHWNNYDLIVSSAMLEYLPKDKLVTALGNLKKLLKSGGRMFIIISHDSWLMRLLITKWWQANLYNQEEFKNYLNKAGLQVVRFRRFPFPYNYLNYWGMVVEIQ